ncbi:MAG: hypothetical protein AAGB19_08370 [Cyanobacteria bacterium P01_F01_bin.3]
MNKTDYFCVSVGFGYLLRKGLTPGFATPLGYDFAQPSETLSTDP